MNQHQEYLQEMLARIYGATSAIQAGQLEQTINTGNKHLQAELAEVYPQWFTPEGFEPVSVNIDSPTYNITQPVGRPVNVASFPPAPVPPPRRPLWPWLLMLGSLATGAGLAAAAPLILSAARQHAPVIVHPAPQQPPVIHLPPQQPPRDPGEYFLRPGQPVAD